MRANAWLYAVIAGASLTGCQSMMFSQQIPPTATTCENTKVCFIPVSVVGCAVSIPPEKVDVVAKGNYVAIFWHLTLPSIAQKYAFDPNKGVALKAPDPSGQFTVQQPVFNNLVYIWVDKNTNWQTYGYSINIIDTGNGNRPCPPLDPQVINN